MENEFVTYPLALRLKELGFDEPCMAVYFGNGENELFTFNPAIAKENTERMVELGHIPCPTYSQAFRWFDYSTEWSGFIVPSKEEGCFEWWIQNYEDPNYLTIESEDWYRGREEAELACLEKLIELVEQKEKYGKRNT
jgi:hypothetical protein